MLELSHHELDVVREIADRRPAVGLALGVVHDGRPATVFGRGLARIASRVPITEDTVFRIGSITKLFTAIAVMQLFEQGRLDLDAPANAYLRAYRLVPAASHFHPPTVRHLLTHTAGIPEVRSLADLLHADLTPAGGRPAMLSVPAGRPLPPLSAYYRHGLRFVVEPGTAFAYTNHGFATLGQLVEEVSGERLDRYFREHLFGPLGMEDTDLVRSARIESGLATGYTMGRHGAKPATDREWIGAGAGGIYSTPRDMSRFVAALLEEGTNEHGRILDPPTLATMLGPHYQPDPRIAGVGLGFFRGEIAGHRVVSHDGILPGFNSALLLAPDDGIGLLAFTNGSPGAFGWLPVELHTLLGRLLGVSDDVAPRDVPDRPEAWPGFCGRYVFPPRISDLRGRLMLGGGVEVFIGGGGLRARVLTPIPLLLRGLRLEPADEQDPDAFRLDLSSAGMSPLRVVFGRDRAGRVTAVHTDLGGQPWSLVRPGASGGRHRLAVPGGALLAVGLVAAMRRWRRERRRGDRGSP